MVRRFYQGGIPLNQAPLCVVEGQVEEPSVAVGPGGGFVVVWADSSTGLIYAGVLSAECVPQGSSSIQVSPTGESAWDLSVSMDSDEDFVVAWTSGEGYPGISVRRFAPGGIALGWEITVSSPGPMVNSNPAVAMDEDGDFVVAWAETGYVEKEVC